MLKCKIICRASEVSECKGYRQHIINSNKLWYMFFFKVKNKQLLVESLMLHTVLSKNKVVLDQLRKGLQILNVLDEIMKRPRLFENLFLNNPNVCDVTPERVISSLNFSTTESCATRDHILQYINECSKQGMIYFCNSVLRTQKIVSFWEIVYYMYCT